MEKAYLKNKEEPKIAVVSFPMGSALVANVLLYNLVEILEPICNKIYIVTGNIPKDRIFSKKIRIQDVKISTHLKSKIHPIWWSNLLQFFKIIIIQMKMCWVLIKISKEINLVFFYIGGGDLFFPLLMAKLLRKKSITSAIGLCSFSYKKASSKRYSVGIVISIIYGILERANFCLSDCIIVESENVVNFLGLEKYREKLVTSGARYIDTNYFQIKKKLKEREKLIGYIGRLGEEKGIMNFVEAFPLILEENDNLRFFIGGNGPLYNRIEDELNNNKISQKVEMMGWISHDKIADYLNELKLLILPSYSEGLPTIILEAMACGTPVLATPVGGVPDVIIDGKTGFILKDNSPECIAKNVIRVLEYPDIDLILENAKKLVDEKYKYEVALERYRKIL